jgi:2-(1,2-epoxy-1,2-dihydrophenyl)acetyl-CoA isomerase
MQTLDYSVKDGIAIVTLNRPQSKNSIDSAMLEELGDVVASVQRDRDVRVLLLTGAGGEFCSGGDLRQMRDGASRTVEQRRASVARYDRITRGLMELDRPIIAAVDGVAFGAGFSLALLADIVIASTRARFCMVFQRMGLIPDMGASYTLPRVVGLQRAKELVFSAREIDAHEAQRLGIALEVVAPDELLGRATALAVGFTGASATAVSLAKTALKTGLQSDLSTVLELEATGQAVASASDYTREAVRRFIAKEPPQFRWPDAKI